MSFGYNTVVNDYGERTKTLYIIWNILLGEENEKTNYDVIY